MKGDSGASGLILGCVSFVMQASVLDGFAFDPSLSNRMVLLCPK